MNLRNEHVLDRAFRIVLGLVLLGLGWGGFVQGVPGTVLRIAGFVPVLTGLVGFCPLYRVFGWSTCRR